MADNANENLPDDDDEIDEELAKDFVKLNDPKAQKEYLARKRIEELLEKKRLKELLDDEEDWDVE